MVPHFEKMLYDNALLARVYAHLWRRSGSELARRVARETCAWMLAELGTPEGGLASALDADSDGAEGLFYTWTPDELTAALGREDAEYAAAEFGVTAAGTFEHGRSVLQRRADPADSARFERIRAALLAARGQRVRPGRDDKVVAAWNGLAIAALAETGLLLGEPGVRGRGPAGGGVAGPGALLGRAAGPHVTGRRGVRQRRSTRGLCVRGRGAADPVRGNRRDALAVPGGGVAGHRAGAVRRRGRRLLRHRRRR